MAGLIAAAVRVTALQPSRRRAGLAFTSSPRDLSREELGEGIEGLKRLCMIFGDPALSVSFVDDDGQVHALTEEQKDELLAYVAAEELRVDPDKPPTLVGELQPEDDGLTQAAGTVFSGALYRDTFSPPVPLTVEPETAPMSLGGSDFAAATHEPDTAPAEASKPAGEDIPSPAAEATGSTKPKRGKAVSAGA